MKIESSLYKQLRDDFNQKVQCNLCAHKCIISKNNYGICKIRKNIDGKLYDCNYGVISSFNIDPIEKKPLYHFLPGSLTYSVGGFGCNMKCLHCQNYTISQKLPSFNKCTKIIPESLVENLKNSGSTSIAWTYNEPTLSFRMIEKTSSLLDENIKTVFVSNGYFSEESLERLVPLVDGFNIDLKSMTNEFYKDICGASLEPVLNNLKKIYNSGKHLEITNLLINDLNDSNNEINDLCDFIVSELSEKVPLHFSRAFPHYKLMDISPTKTDSMINAKKIAKDHGIQYVYLGNTSLDQNTYCPNCGELLVKREGYRTISKINVNKCFNCGYNLNFYL